MDVKIAAGSFTIPDYTDPQYIPDELTVLLEAEAVHALREAWHKIYGQYPSDNSLGVLFAKSALETGRYKLIHCYNFGNIKKKRKTATSQDDGHFFTMFRCGEVLNGKHIMFEPPHIQTHFRAYKSTQEGAEDYIRFVSQNERYKKAWQKVLEGDPKGYAHELKIAKYYTASETIYTAGVIKLFEEFLRRKEELLSWRDTDPAPPAEMIMEEETIFSDNIHDTDIDTVPDIVLDVVNNTKITEKTPIKTPGTRNGAYALALLALGGLGAIYSLIAQSCQ